MAQHGVRGRTRGPMYAIVWFVVTSLLSLACLTFLANINALNDTRMVFLIIKPTAM